LTVKGLTIFFGASTCLNTALGSNHLGSTYSIINQSINQSINHHLCGVIVTFFGALNPWQTAKISAEAAREAAGLKISTFSKKFCNTHIIDV
jgi:hypothetical protein